MKHLNANRMIDERLSQLSEMPVQPKDKLDDFMKDFWKKSYPNPIDSRSRVIGFRIKGVEGYVMFVLRPWEGRIHVEEFGVLPPSVRNMGFGRAGMEWLMDLAREHNVDLAGTAVPYGAPPRLSKAKLLKFYKGMGYKTDGDEILFDPEAE